jgi:hypothetical protein
MAQGSGNRSLEVQINRQSGLGFGLSSSVGRSAWSWLAG